MRAPRVRALPTQRPIHATSSPGDVLLKEEPAVRIERTTTTRGSAVRKTYRNRGLRCLQTWLRPARARREHRNLCRVSAAGIACTEAWSWSERRWLGFALESTLVTGWVDGCRSLEQVVRETPAGARRAALAAATGILLAQLHRNGLLWNTAYPRNVLVRESEGDRLWLCDAPDLQRYPRSVHGTALAHFDLYDAAFSPSRMRMWSSPERLRLVLAYCEGNRALARRIWRSLSHRSRLLRRWKRQVLLGLGSGIVWRFLPWLHRRHSE